MRTTVHVQRDKAEHYEVVLKHRSGQPKTIHHLRIKHGKVRSEESVFFGRNSFDEVNEQGIVLGFIGADHEDLRMAIDCLTELRNHLRYKAANPKELLEQCIKDDKVREFSVQFEGMNHVEPSEGGTVNLAVHELIGTDTGSDVKVLMKQAKRPKKNSTKRTLRQKKARKSPKKLTTTDV